MQWTPFDFETGEPGPEIARSFATNEVLRTHSRCCSPSTSSTLSPSPLRT